MGIHRDFLWSSRYVTFLRPFVRATADVLEHTWLTWAAHAKPTTGVSAAGGNVSIEQRAHLETN